MRILETVKKPSAPSIPAENAVIDAAAIAAITETETKARKAKSGELKAKRLAKPPVTKADTEAKPETAPTVETTTASEAHADNATVLDNATGETVSNNGLARDASGIVRNATNFEQYSDRDTAYLRFFGSVMRQHGDTATLKQIHEAGKADGKKRRNPFYAGSAKATDVGAINRLKKAGYILASADGNTLTATDTAKASKAYLGTIAG